MGSSLITADKVVKRFDARTVIHELSFVVQEGQITGLLGPNGSGKTTMVRLINGVLRPDSGQLTVAGYDPAQQGDQVRLMSGVLTESVDFYRHLTGLDNLRFFASLYGAAEPDRPKQLLETFGLAAHQDKKVGTYSTGMRRRLGLARALLHRPRILFLDEPTNGLDPEGTQMVLEYIKNLNARDGTTILICSHLLNQMEAVCHRYLFVDEGRLMEQGTLAELEQRHQRDLVLTVDTDLDPGTQPIQGADLLASNSGALGQRRLQLAVPNKEAIPGLLRHLTHTAAVYSAQLSQRDLESLYFKIREAKRS